MRKVLIFSLLTVLLFSSVASAQTAPDKSDYYISEAFSTSNSDILAFKVKGSDNAEGLAYYNYVTDRFVDQVDIYSPDTVDPRDTSPNTIIDNQYTANVFDLGNGKLLQIKDNNGAVIEEYSDQNKLFYANSDDLEVSAFKQSDDIAIAVAAYDPVSNYTLVFLFSSVSDTLYDTAGYKYRINLDNLKYFSGEELVQTDITMNDTDSLGFYKFSINEFKFMQDDSNKRIQHIDKFSKIVFSVENKASKPTDNIIRVSNYNSAVENYEREITPSQLAPYVKTDNNSLGNEFLVLSLTSFSVLFLISHQKKNEI